MDLIRARLELAEADYVAPYATAQRRKQQDEIRAGDDEAVLEGTRQLLGR